MKKRQTVYQSVKIMIFKIFSRNFWQNSSPELILLNSSVFHGQKALEKMRCVWLIVSELFRLNSISIPPGSDKFQKNTPKKKDKV